MRRWATLTEDLRFSEITFDGEWYRVRVTDESGQVLMENDSISLQGAKKQVKRYIGGTKKIRWNLVETDKVEAPSALHLPLNYLSIAQVNSYLSCPKQYEMKYVDKIADGTGSAQIMERAFRVSMRNAMRRKVSDKRSVGTRDVLDIYAAAFDRELNKHDIDWQEGENPGIVKDNGIRLTRAYYDEYGKDLIPYVNQNGDVQAETVLKYDIVPGLKVRDIIHLIDNTHTVRDYSVGAGFPSAAIEDQIELPIHAITARQILGKEEKAVGIDHVFMFGEERKIIRAESTGPILDQRIDRAKQTFVGVAKAISAGIFYPNERSHICGKCPFNKICRK